MRNTLILFFCLLVTLNISAQKDHLVSLENYYSKFSSEKLYLHTDRNLYSTGDEIWVSIYLVDSRTHRPTASSKVVYLELRSRNNEVISTTSCYVPEGFGSSDILIREDLTEGDYVLIAYTNVNRNSELDLIYQRDIKIVSGNKESNDSSEQYSKKLQFYPEGGSCIEGIPCRIAVLSSVVSDESINIMASDGSTATTFTDDQEYNIFTYTPLADRTYHAVAGGSNYPLPDARPSGLSLKADVANDNIEVTLYSSAREEKIQSQLLIHARGHVFSDTSIVLHNSETLLSWPLRKFGTGVNHITLFDEQWNPVAERLIYVASNLENYNITVDTDIAPKSEGISSIYFDVPINFDIEDSLNIARLSCSIVPTSANMNITNNNIFSWLTLNSDLEEEVNIDPIVFLSDLDEKSKREIDLQLLSRGWRTFDWSNTAKYKKEVTYQPEPGLSLKGRMVRPLNESKGVEGKVFLTNFSSGTMLESITDNDGYFHFGPFTNMNPESVILQGRFNKRKSKNLNTITTEDNGTVLFDFLESAPPTISISENAIAYSSFDAFLNLDQEIKYSMDHFDQNTIKIDEVVFSSTAISSYEAELNHRAAAMGIKSPSTRVVIDSLTYDPIGGTAYDLLRNIPGLVVRGIDGARGMSDKGGNEEILMRGSNSLLIDRPGPIIIVDGIPVPASFLQDLPIRNIEFIDVVRGMRAGVASFGTRAMNGAVVFYLRRSGRSIKKFGVADNFYSKILDGLQAQRKFPNYAEVSRLTQSKDIRKTIAWEPNIVTDDLGLGQMAFTMSDQKGEFLILVEGLKMDGTPLLGVKKFKVE